MIDDERDPWVCNCHGKVLSKRFQVDLSWIAHPHPDDPDTIVFYGTRSELLDHINRQAMFEVYYCEEWPGDWAEEPEYIGRKMWGDK